MELSPDFIKKNNLNHFRYLSDDFGIWQHTRGKIIDIKHGYALDDAARGLIIALEYGMQRQAQTFLDFIRAATSNGRVVNFFGPDKKPLDLPWSEDALGESYWAVAYAKKRGLNIEISTRLVERLDIHANKFTSLRGRAYSLLGSILASKETARKLAASIYDEYLLNKKPNWLWPEPNLSYGNAIIPLSLLEFSLHYPNPEIEDASKLMLNFLNRVTKVKKTPIAIGNRGWFQLGLKKAIYDQQPIDIAYQVLANIRAYEILNEKNYLDEAKTYFSWFWGNNVAKKPLIDIRDWSCLDGICENKLSRNRGAESVICYLMAERAMEPYLGEGGVGSRE